MKRLTIQLTDEQHKIMTDKVAERNLPSVAEFIREAIVGYNPKKRKAAKVAVKAPAKKATKLVAKKVSKKTSQK